MLYEASDAQRAGAERESRTRVTLLSALVQAPRSASAFESGHA